MTGQPFLENLTTLTDELGLHLFAGAFSATPAPATHRVATPLADMLDVLVGNTPGVEIEKVRLALFTTGSSLPLCGKLTAALLGAGLTVTGRRYVGFEKDTGLQHCGIDVAAHNTCTLEGR